MNIRMDENELIERLLADDPAAWSELVASYRPRLAARALRIVKCQEDAEEVAMEALQRLRRALPNFRRECSVLSLLVSIVHNCALNRWHYWKRRRRDVSVAIDAEQAGGGTLANLISNGDLPVPAQAELGELEQAIGRALTQLSPDRRGLIEQLLLGKSYKEMAAQRGIPVGSIKSRISRARLDLRRILRDRYQVGRAAA